MRVILGSSVGRGDERGGKAGVELSEATSKPFTLHSSMTGKDVVVEGGKVSGTGMALGCAPVEQVIRRAIVAGSLCS